LSFWAVPIGPVMCLKRGHVRPLSQLVVEAGRGSRPGSAA
jgi:hypothetical protein